MLTQYYAIAVSGQSCSGKSTICKLLGEKLAWKHVDIGSEFRKLAANNHLEIENFGSIPDNHLREIDLQISQRICTEHCVVWDGRLACYLSRKIQGVFKVYCGAPIEVRSQRLASREGISVEIAKAKIERRDLEEKEVFERLYSLSDPFNAEWTDLKISTLKSPEFLVEEVLNQLK